MWVRPKVLGILLKRELSAVTGYVALLLLIIAFIGAVAGLQLSHRPIIYFLSNSFGAIAAMAVAGLFQYAYVLISNEKSRGTFLFLRTLPISNDEAMLSKILALLLSLSITYLVPTITVFFLIRHFGSATPELDFWADLWTLWHLNFSAIIFVAALIAFEQRKAGLVALPVFLAPAAGYFLGRVIFGGGFWQTGWFLLLARWAILPAAFGIWWAIIFTLRLYRRRDFVQLVE